MISPHLWLRCNCFVTAIPMRASDPTQTDGRGVVLHIRCAVREAHFTFSGNRRNEARALERGLLAISCFRFVARRILVDRGDKTEFFAYGRLFLSVKSRMLGWALPKLLKVFTGRPPLSFSSGLKCRIEFRRRAWQLVFRRALPFFSCFVFSERIPWFTTG